MLAVGCATGPRVVGPPPDVLNGIALQRPRVGDPRRYELAAWGQDYLLEFRWRDFFGPERVLRIYPDRTVCSVSTERGSLFRFRAGSADPDDDAALADPSQAGEIKTQKARFEVLGAEKTALLARLPRLELQVVGSASRSETKTPEEAIALSENRARAVARLLRQARPDVAMDQIEIMALGWDGFAAPGQASPGVTIVGGALAARDLNLVYLGPPIPPRLDALLRADLERGGNQALEIAYSPQCVISSKEEAAELRRRNALLAPFFAAIDAGCRIPEEGLLRFLEAHAWRGIEPESIPEPEVQLPPDKLGAPER